MRNRTILVVLAFVLLPDLASTLEAQNEDAIYEIRSVHESNKCIEIKSSSTKSGALAQIYGCHGGKNQRWKLVSDGLGRHSLVAVHSNKCLDVQGAHTDEGRNVQQFGCHGGSNQLWTVVLDGLHYEFIAAHSGKCLHANNGEGFLTRNDLLEQRSCNNVNWQKWILNVKALCKNSICESSEGEDSTNCSEDCPTGGGGGGGGGSSLAVNVECQPTFSPVGVEQFVCVAVPSGGSGGYNFAWYYSGDGTMTWSGDTADIAIEECNDGVNPIIVTVTDSNGGFASDTENVICGGCGPFACPPW